MFTDLVSGTGTVSLSASLSTALDAATILKALDRYPYGCSEQITSRAMPQLYVNDLAAGAHLAMDTGVDQRIKDAIDRLLARQGSNGSFGLWSAGGDDAWLDAYVTDFLTRAREKGFTVPDVLFKSALDRVRNSVVNADEPEKDGGHNLAYGLYVLARNGVAPIGDLRYLADTKLGNLTTSIAKIAIGGGAGAGRRQSESGAGSTPPALDSLSPQPTLEFGRADYGSALRDAAALVSLASEGNAPRATLTQAVERVEVARGLTPYTSTQENAWLVLASRALSKETLALDIDGASLKTAVYRSYKAAEMAGKPVKITNTGDTPVQMVVSVSGAPITPEPAASNGFKIERNYFTLDGKPADVSKATQNDRFAVVLKITEPKPEFGHIMVSDYLPAGLEIDNPHLVSSGDTGTLDWIEDGEAPENTEFRDDRFTAAIDRKSDDKSVFTVAYVVRAVTPGGYVLPQAYVEDMYNPSRYGRTTATGAGRGARGEMNQAIAIAPPARDWRRIRLAGAAFAIAGLLALAAFAGWVASLGPLPLAQARQISQTVVDRHGKLLRAYAMADGRWRLPVDARTEVDPGYLKLLFAYEDKRFYSHHGVDPLALGRAALQLGTRGRIVSGGSTITMQLARLMEPRRQRSVHAKLRQMVRAIEIERQLTKDQILDLYLALAPYGGNLEGIRAASIAYFGKEPKRLSLAETALLVALPQSPENRRLDRHPRTPHRARPGARSHGRGRSGVGGRCRRREGRSGAADAQGDSHTGAAFRRPGRCHLQG